jgi:hypothetical protein
MALKPSQGAQFVLGPDVWQERFTISVSADDLSVIAEHGYEGAASTDQDCRSQAISRCISDTVACLDRTG